MKGIEITKYISKTKMPDLERVRENCHRQAVSGTVKQRSAWPLRVASVSACAIVVIMAVLILGKNGLFTPSVTNNDTPAVQSKDNTPSASIGNGQDTPGDMPDSNSGLYPLYALTFNKGDSLMQTDAARAFGCFDYDLTDGQLNAVFPNTDLLLAANAFYSEDGRLLYVTAVETLVPGRMEYAIKYDEVFNRTDIKLGEGAIIEDCVVIYEDTPQVSDVCGVPVTAYMFDFNKEDDVVFFQAEFMLDNIAYRISIYDNSADGQKRLTEIVNAIILNGAANLAVLANPIIPEMRHEQLTLDESLLDPDFGTFIPATIPNGFAFESAYRVITQRENSLFVHWGKPNNYLEWRVSLPTEYDLGHIVSVNDLEKYDLSLYPIPRAESVPVELREYVDNPVFRAEELTLDVVRARAYWVDADRGDTPAWRMDFNVLYNDVVVRVTAKGVTPEQVWEMLNDLRN